MSDLFKLLFTTILHCALLTSATLMAQETPPTVNASDTNVARPTLEELMVKFAEIEASFLPFHIEYSEFQYRKISFFREETNTGKSWEARYKIQPLLDEMAIAACMAYVDLNPIRAGIALTPETSDFTSVHERIVDRQSAVNIGDERQAPSSGLSATFSPGAQRR